MKYNRIKCMEIMDKAAYESGSPELVFFKDTPKKIRYGSIVTGIKLNFICFRIASSGLYANTS